MILQVKYKVKLYRRFEKDIWGLVLNNLNPKAKYLGFLEKLYLFKKARQEQAYGNFVYDRVLIFKRKDQKKMKKRFVTIRLLKLYYLSLSYKQFRRLGQWAGRRDGFFQSNFCYRLEGRLVSLLYRSNLVANMFMAIHVVKSGQVLVNGRVRRGVNYLVQVGDLITFLAADYPFFRFHLLRRFKLGGVFFSVPRFLFVSYKLFLLTLLAYPQVKDLAFPTKIDIFRLTGYY